MLALNGLLHHAILTLFVGTLWMIVVSANIDRTMMFLVVVALIFEVVGNFLTSALNDKSQFAKLFLVVAQFFGLIAGIMTIWIANLYYESKETHHAHHKRMNSTKDANDTVDSNSTTKVIAMAQEVDAGDGDSDLPHLHQLQVDGMTLNQLIMILITIFLLSMCHAIHKAVVA